MKGYLRPAEGAEYYGVCERTFQIWLRSGLKSYLIGGCRLVKIIDIEEFVKTFPYSEDKADQIVESMMKGIDRCKN